MLSDGTRTSARSMTLRAQGLACAVLAMAIVGGAHAQTAVLQRGYNHWLTGADLTETTLNVSNVTAETFGQIFTLPVNDAIFAQPLYVPGVAIANEGTHNVVYVATMSDTLYAFDADNGAELWAVNLASLLGATPVPIAQYVFSGNKNIVGNLGILSTPVIDPATNLMYVVSCTLEKGVMTYRLWAINITNGTRPKGPGVVIQGSYTNPNSTTVTFDARYQTQRVSLALWGQQVVFGFGAIELEYAGGYVGWVMTYNKVSMKQSGLFATVTSGNEGGGVWQSGRPAAIDASGFAYVYTGNGYGSGYDGKVAFSESALKLDALHGLGTPKDWFTPGNWSTLDTKDLDLSSSGPLLIPNSSPLLLAGGGKGAEFYLLDTTNMGHSTATDTGVVQEFAMPYQFRGGPVLWQRSAAWGGTLLYNWGSGDVAKAFAFNGATFTETPASQSSTAEAYPGGILALSAYGERHNTGILWATVATSGDAMNDPPVPGALYALNAENLSQDLWDSTMNPTRDGFGNFGKLVPPLVANGRVYVATWSNQVAVYGLLSTYTALPSTLAFGSEPLNTTSAARTVTVMNTGTIPLIIKSILLSSTGPDPFSQTNTCASAVAVGGSCTISVAFDPKTAGAAQATLSVSTGNDAGTQKIALSGTGS
jgi:hypothetical protein